MTYVTETKIKLYWCEMHSRYERVDNKKDPGETRKQTQGLWIDCITRLFQSTQTKID